MASALNLDKLKTSWTKYDIVQVLDVVKSVDVIKQYKNKEADINEAVLKSFLGINNLEDPIPHYWIEIQKYPNEKKIFALLALIFTHIEIVKDFANIYSKGNMKGVFRLIPKNKTSTNLRSALVVSEASDPTYRRKEKVPYDFSVALYNPEVGKLFKEVLKERISRCTTETLTEDQFYDVCIGNLFHRTLSLTKDQFRLWLNGESFDGNYIKNITIDHFFSIKEKVTLNFFDSKEIYFLGENGDGKSLLLMALYLAFNGNYITEKTDKEHTGKAIDIIDESIKLKGHDTGKHEYSITNAIYLDNLYAYGIHRGRYDSARYEKYGFMSLFDNDLSLISPVQWIKDLKLKEDENKTRLSPVESAIAITKLQQLLHEILERNVLVTVEGSNVFFVEKGCKLNLDQLSEGYRSIIIFVCDLLSRICAKHKGNGDVLKTKGVVLVDEIDQHLHPRWQKVIVSKLRELFPNIQFFFTTHSPTTIQGASEDAIIYRAYRENGLTKISEPYHRKDLDHLMINTLLTSSLFGLENSRLDADNDNSITDDTYLLFRINSKLESKVQEQRLSGKNFLSDREIDDLIDAILNEELNHDKSK